MADESTETKEKPDYESTTEDKIFGIGIGVVYILLAVLLSWMLFKIWPPTPWPSDKSLLNNPLAIKYLTDGSCPISVPTQSPAPADAGEKAKEAAVTAEMLISIPISFAGKCYSTSFDERLIMLVIVAGMLGSFVHGATSLADYFGNNKFNKNWSWFYVLRPAIGMSLALVFYFVIRGGFLTTSGGAKDINPYGIAALAGMVGMFSKQATDKLGEVFSTLFRSAGDANRSDPLKSDNPSGEVSITDLDVKQVAAGTTDRTVVITGTNFVAGTKVVLNDIEQTETTVDSPTQITVKLNDESIAKAGDFKLTVRTPDGKESTLGFKVVEAEG